MRRWCGAAKQARATSPPVPHTSTRAHTMGDAEDETPVPEADADEEDSPAPTFVAEAEELRDLVRAAVANVATPEQYARLHAIVRAHRRLPEEAAQDAGRSVEAPSHAHCSFRRPRRGAQFMKYQEQPQLLDPHLERARPAWVQRQALRIPVPGLSRRRRFR